MPLDTDGNNKLDQSDAIELFVATTLQGFGAEQLLTKFRQAHPSGAVTPIATVLATVKTAMDQYA